MFGFLKRKKKGCLHGKTEKEIHEFFVSLCGFASSNPAFFNQQYKDLKPEERTKLLEWIDKQKQIIYKGKGIAEFIKSLPKK